MLNQTNPASDTDDDYLGAAEFSFENQTLTGQVQLRGHFEPIDGKFHWYGRIATNSEVNNLPAGSQVEIRTPDGSALGKLTDKDPWGRYRITGTGSPPFLVE